MELEEITSALYEWADKSEKRNVLCIATEKCNETQEGYCLSTLTVINGKRGILVDALADSMKSNEELANVIKDVSFKHIIYRIKKSEAFVGADEVSVKAGKEDDDE